MNLETRDSISPSLATEASLYDVRAARPTENKPLQIRIILEVEPCSAAALLVQHVGQRYDVVLTPKPPPPTRAKEPDPRQAFLPGIDAVAAGPLDGEW